MKPYIAVIKDSFREAFASRVLWILLIVITVMLLAVAPFCIREYRPARLYLSTVFDWPGLAGRLRQEGERPEKSPGKHIWSLLDGGLRQKLLEVPAEPEIVQVPSELSSALLNDLNRLLGERRLYDEEAWRDMELAQEASDLIRRGPSRLNEEDLARLNRILLESAFPEQIARSATSDIYLAYFSWKLGEPFSISRSQVTSLLKTILAGVMNIVVGALAVFIAILVTSPVIPHTFEAGAIDLLLSKPVSRALLFLAKFVGGCAFILLNAAYLIVGLWLIVGLRFELWSGKLLLCIPIFMFLFAIYYSVSSFAGVLWKNAIVSIVITMLFWAACFVVGTTKNVIEQLFLKPHRLARLVPAGDSLFALNDQGRALLWQDGNRKWEPVLVSEQDPELVGPMTVAPPVLGPVYDTRNDRLLAMKLPSGFRLGPSDASLVMGSRVDGWSRTAGAAPPRDPVGLFSASDGSILIVTKQSVFRLEGNPQEKAREFKVLGLRIPLAGARSPFVAIGPQPLLRLSHPATVAINPDNGALAIWNRGTLLVLERTEDGTYQRAMETAFENETKAVVLGFAGSTVMVAQADGHIRVIDAHDGTVSHEFRPEGKNQPRAIETSPGGRWFVVVFHHYKTWVWDTQQNKEVKPGFVGRSDISSATFTSPNRLLLADRGTRVTEYELEPFRMVGQRAPELSALERVYYYGILPVYTVFPKPGELDNMVAYLLTEQETAAVGPDSDNLSTAQVKLNVTGPVWSSLAFTLVMLAITCLYVSRADF